MSHTKAAPSSPQATIIAQVPSPVLHEMRAEGTSTLKKTL